MTSNEYKDLLEPNKDYIDISDALYKLKTFDEAEIDEIYQNIKNKLLETKRLSPSEVSRMISTASSYNARYFKSYMRIFEKLFEDYQPKHVNFDSDLFGYFFYKMHGIILDPSNKKNFKYYESQNYTIDVHEENTICRAIMEDDLKSFIAFTEAADFNSHQMIESSFYPYSDTYNGYYYLDLCCYYGAVNCYKFLRAKDPSFMSIFCFKLALLGGNQEIVNDLLKDPETVDIMKDDEDTMIYAIITHNIDFVTYLMNEHGLEMCLEDCIKYNNLHAFLVYLDQTKNYNECFVHSPAFHSFSICEYLIAHGADINAKSIRGKNALQVAAEANNKEMVEFLVTHGVNANEHDLEFGKYPIHYATQINSKEIVEILIANGADVNKNDYGSQTALHYAAIYDCAEIAEILITHGANIEAEDFKERTPLFDAAKYNSVDTGKVLISHDAFIDAVDTYGQTCLDVAYGKDSEEMEDLLASYGAEYGE